MNRIEKAKELFTNGYNCSQAVVGAYCDLFGMDFETAMKVSEGFGGGMGGFGGGFGGGMGMGGMGMGAPAAAPASKKLVIATYMKKRIFTFVLIGICAVLLTCTCFLDVGTKIGMWILEMVSGI